MPMGYEPENRIGRLYGQGLWPLDENGMEQVPVLGRDEPDPETKRALRELCRDWRDARIKMKQAAEAPELDEELKGGVVAHWACDVGRIEDEAAALALLSAGVVLPGEPIPRDGFPPISLDVGGGWSVVVAPAVTPCGRRSVAFMARTATST
jgi:hypothetical protein